MRILHLSTSDIRGGAALGTYWLHKGLCEAGHDSRLLVQFKSSDDPSVTPLRSIKKVAGRKVDLRIIIEWLSQKIIRLCGLSPQGLFSPQIWAPGTLADEINAFKPDIVHMHWVQNGFVMPEDIPDIKAPIVWTARDMWLLTGGEHYTKDEDRLGNAEKTSLGRRKKKAFSRKKDITFVAISHWLLDLMKQSPLFENHSKVMIHNGIPEEWFSKPAPADKEKLYRSLNLEPDKKYIIFGAQNAAKDPRKGFRHVLKVIQAFKDRPDICFLMFGAEQEECEITGPFADRIKALGFIEPKDLAAYYQISDLTLVPSEQEAFGKVAAESIMCGTPVVSFDIGGLKDIVGHKVTGWKAAPFSERSLIEGVNWCLQHDLKGQMHSCHVDFGVKKMVAAYTRLYENILQDREK